MLDFNIRGENIEVTPSIREHVEKKLQKIERYFDESANATANVNMKVYNDKQTKVEVTIPMKNLTLRAEERHNDLYAAIDLIVDKLERQIRKYKTKVNRKFREREGVAAFFASVNKSEEKNSDATLGRGSGIRNRPYKEFRSKTDGPRRSNSSNEHAWPRYSSSSQMQILTAQTSFINVAMVNTV